MLIDGLELSEGSDFKNLTVASGSAFPTQPTQGELFFKVDDLTLYVYNGSAWVGIVTLGANAKIAMSQIPSIAITDVFQVSSQAQMLALVAERGDVAIRSDLNKTFILSDESPTTLASWIEISVPVGAVSSVNGQTGAVNITTITGNAATASKLNATRTVALGGDLSGSASFDGSGDVTITATLNGDKVGTKTFNGAVACDLINDGSYIVGNVTGATTLSLTGVPNDGKAYGMSFELTNAGSNITWPASVSWLGTAPTLRASGVSLVTLVTRNGGSTWLGSAA